MATDHDTPVVISLLQELHTASEYNKHIPFDKQSTLETLSALLDSPKEDTCCILLEGPDKSVIGILVCSHMTHMFNKKEKTAVELAFWIRPEHRTLSGTKELLKAYRYWAKKIGCTSLFMGHLQNGSVETYKIKRIN